MGIVTSSEVAAGGRLSARTMGCAEDVEVGSRGRKQDALTRHGLALETLHRKMTFSPECAMNSGGRMIVVMPYQLKPKGTMRTTGGLFAISGGAVRKGVNVMGPVMRISLAARVRRRLGTGGRTPVVALGRRRRAVILGTAVPLP